MNNSTTFGKNFCPSCRLAVSRDSGRLKWCGGDEGDKCRRGRCRILFILPVLLLPIVILLIIVTHLSGFGSVMTSASQQPPDPAPTPSLDNPISVDPTAPIIFEQPILLEPELAELKEREWLREPKTSFIPPASQRLQMPKALKRIRRDTDVPEQYPSEESGLSDKIIWKEVPHHSKRGLNFGDFLSIVRKKINSTNTELEKITHKLFIPKNLKSKNSESSREFTTEEGLKISVLDKDSKERVENFRNKEMASREQNVKHSFSNSVPSDSKKYNESEYNEPMQRQSHQERGKQIIRKNDDNIKTKNDNDFHTEKYIFDQGYSTKLNSGKNLFSKHYLKGKTLTFSKEYSREIPDEGDYSPRENEQFQHFDIENQPNVDRQNDSSNHELPLEAIQNFSSKIESNAETDLSDDFTLEKKLPEYLDKVRNLQKPWQYQNSHEVFTYNKYEENPPFVNRLVSKYAISNSNKYQKKSGGNLDLRERNSTRVKQENSLHRGSQQTFKNNESNKKARPLSDYLMRFRNVEKNETYIQPNTMSLNKKFSNLDLTTSSEIDSNFSIIQQKNINQNENIDHGFDETFPDKQLEFASSLENNPHQLLLHQTTTSKSPSDTSTHSNKLSTNREYLDELISDGNHFENDQSLEKDQNTQKPIRRNYFGHESPNKYFQITEKRKIFRSKPTKEKDNSELPDFFQNYPPVNINREEILAIPIDSGLPSSLPINAAVMSQGETSPEEYPLVKISSRAKKSSLKVTGEDQDSETPNGSFEEPPVVMDVETTPSESNMDTIQVESHESTKCPYEKDEEEELSPTSYEKSEGNLEVDSQEHLHRQGDAESIRKAQASMMKRFMNETVDPCDDFYQYACGNWGRYNPIPKDKSGYDTFEMLRESLDSVLRELLEETVNPVHTDYQKDAIVKAKQLFQSCMNYDILEQRAEKPLVRLLDELGGWPVLRPNWDPESFDWLFLTAQLRLYNNDILVSEWVGPDIKNSDEYIIQLDQTSLGLPTRDYFLQPSNEVYLNAYKNYMIKIATLLGASVENATLHAEELIEFETKLAKITSSPNERRNVSELYQRMTLGSLGKHVPQINWLRYMTIVLARPVSPSEPVVVFALRYLQDLVTLLGNSKSSTIADYLLWRFVRHRANNLDDRFQEAKQRFYYILFGREQAPPRWKNCISQVNSNMGMAVGAMFVQKYFDENSKNDTLDMTLEIMNSFRDLLDETTWIDTETKRLAAEKVDAMTLRIGYPDFILNLDQLNDRYKDVVILPDEYFENTLNILQHLTRVEQDRLGTLVNKTQWNTAPAVVNAYYSRNKNQIMFPAGILQPPFYHRYFPRSLNLGGIGVVIGHEITHGFDDKGRLFDKYGNLHRWWKDEAIQAFHQRSQCLIDQYSHYTVQEVAMQIDGVNTQGENIADNGGIKQAFKAYKRWAKSHSTLCNETLPGLNLNSEQLFFLNFAQVWCGAMRPEATRNKLKTAVHSPGRFRVIGTLSNSEDFATVFNCPSGSPMNPVNKCSVW